MTKQDMLDVLRGEPNAEEAIFWWAYCWHSGAGSDLYQIMCDSSYIPLQDRKFAEDPMVVRCIEKLDRAFGPLVEHDYKPVKITDVREGQVLIAGSNFPCILPKWPCRVYRHHGELGVACSGGVHGVKLLPGSETTFHPFRIDAEGIIEGFRR